HSWHLRQHGHSRPRSRGVLPIRPPQLDCGASGGTREDRAVARPNRRNRLGGGRSSAFLDNAARRAFRPGPVGGSTLATRSRDGEVDDVSAAERGGGKGAAT